ncbi:hypothetical protein ACFYNY_19750 [Streptomyces sp. NPDC006530]|uniref:hypothetical protein n=1 Tax=Streptomyces sp. NPDC006530 TaxID=3364750 RepID=UPI00369D5C34
MEAYQVGNWVGGTTECLGGIGQIGLFLLPVPKGPAIEVRAASTTGSTVPRSISGFEKMGQITVKLQNLVDQAAKDFDAGNAVLRPKEVQQILSNPNKWRSVVRGNYIDRTVKVAIDNDPGLAADLITAPPFVAAPDVMAPGLHAWWDMTTSTPGEWEKHVDDYIQPYGFGVHLPTDRN